MERRNGFLTFLAALIPGVGYMYLGLLRKGVQALILFLMISPILNLIGLGFLVGPVKFTFIVYTFFDTLSLAKRMDMGEPIYDSDFITNSYNSQNIHNSLNNLKSNRRTLLVIAWGLIIIGILGILNKLFAGNDIYKLIKSYISSIFVPALLVLTGIYLLFKGNSK
ncbi:membrane protein [Fervidicella metallireducens AeB]|uniref:Membrane protein n=1 Tax=Fervidicella metallireducens AeB TaxID=1403537 RepID=A0A017RTK7_9CLOT|nr:hypothetical protein [Fervidicella metallireducens]EYE87799.1 membrane protein [Fervidicella metallireducens AeB]